MQHLVIDMNTSRVIVVLMSEIRRNGPSRSLVFALSRLFDALKYVKINRSRLAKDCYLDFTAFPIYLKLRGACDTCQVL